MKILLPTDFSSNSYQAIQYAYTHFDKSKVSVQLLHVIKEPHSTSNVLLRLDDIMMKDAKKEMTELLDKLEQEFGSRPTFSIHYGHLKNWVEQMSKSMKIDLIVMGTKGENDIASKIMGSVTESIIRTSKTPTLAIPNSNVNTEIREFLLATNRKEIENDTFFHDLLSNLKLNVPHINVLTVLTNEVSGVPKSIPLRGLQVGVKTIENKSVVDGINAYLENNKVDILALYHSRNSRLDYLFNRSITKTICGKIQVPLLVIPIAS